MKVLVTGATGFLGSHIAEQLAQAGYQVRVLVRPTSDRRFLQGFVKEEAIGDVTQPASLPSAVAGVDVAIHVAGLVKARNAAEFDAVNAQGTAHLLAALGQTAPNLRRFVYISSLAAHGPSDDGRPRPLDAPPRPVSAYGRSKLKGEEFVRSWAQRWPVTIIRAPVIYGPRDRATLAFFQMARWRFIPLLGSGQNALSFVYVEDAARAIVQAATANDHARDRTYCLDDGHVYTWRDLLGAIEGAVGHGVYTLSLPPLTFAAAALACETYGAVRRRAVSLTRDKVLEMRQRYWVCSHEAIQQALGWSPQVGLAEGARRTAAWYREHGWL